MYNKITQKLKPRQSPSSSRLPRPTLTVPSMPSIHAPPSTDPDGQHDACIDNFISGLLLMEEAINVSRKVGEMLMINCDDGETLEEMMAEKSTEKYIKDRIYRYYKITEYISVGCPMMIETRNDDKNQQQSFEQTRNITHQNKQTQNINTDTNRCQITQGEYQYGLHGSFKEESISDKKKIVSSRYINNKQEQFIYKPLDGGCYKTKPSTKPTTNKNHSKSISSSNGSHSKSFNGIQIKSIIKLKRKQQISMNEIVEKQNKNIRLTKNKYTISKRQEIKKNGKMIFNQIGNGKKSRNNTVTVSRIDINLRNKTDINQFSQAEHKNRHRYPQNVSTTQVSKNRTKNVGIQIGTDKGNAQIAKHTVQTSNDFINMLKMMSQE